MQVGQKVTFVLYTDRKAGWVKQISKSGKQLVVEFGKQTLLNGINSAQEDALHFEPGGFFGHVSGDQRWLVEKEEHPQLMKFTLRETGKWKAVGASTRSAGSVLIDGHSPFYDFNF